MAEQNLPENGKGGPGRLRTWIIAGTVAAVSLTAIGVGAVYAGGGPGPFMFNHFGGSFLRSGLDQALDSVDATSEQKDEIQAIIEAARTEIGPLVEDMHEKREQVKALIGAQTIDRDAFEELRTETLATADAASERALAAFLDAAEVLTPEQRTELLERGPGFHHGGPGMGMGMGMGMGPWSGHMGSGRN